MSMLKNPFNRSARDIQHPKPLLVGVSTSDSTAITGAQENQTNFDNTYTLPANILRVGSKIRFWGYCKHTATTGTETHSMLLVIGATTLLTVAAIDPANNDYFIFDAEVVITAVGATGSLRGLVRHRVGTATPASLLTTAVEPVAIDTTVANDIAVAIDRQTAATDSDSAVNRVMVVEVTP